MIAIRVNQVNTHVLAAHHPYPSLVAGDEFAKGLVIAVARAHHERIIRDRTVFARGVHGSSLQHGSTTMRMEAALTVQGRFHPH